MTNELVPIKTVKFNGVTLDCYQNDDEEYFWATREQIGRLLEYSKPMRSIANIHERNKERLDKFSTITKLMTVEGNRTVTREVIVYNFKGLLEICRYSNQPKANEVIDFLWEVADDIRQHGMYLSPQLQELLKEDPAVLEAVVKNYLSAKEQIQNLENKLAECQTYATLGKAVLALSGSITFQDAAGFLAQKGIKTGQNRLFKSCREKGYLCKRRGKQWNKPTKKPSTRNYLI